MVDDRCVSESLASQVRIGTYVSCMVIVRQVISVVHMLIAGETTEHRLANQPSQQVAGAVEFQLQAAVEIDPQRALNRFTRWVLHAPTTMIYATY